MMTPLKTSLHSPSICVHYIAHPFSANRQTSLQPQGKSLAEIIRAVQPDALLAAHVHAYINDTYISPCEYPVTIPVHGTTVTLRMVPMGGGGGKNPLRTVLSLAIMAASPAIAGSLSGLLGSSSFLGISAGKFITTGINLIGRLALNALAPPPGTRIGRSVKESPTLFIQGARNQTTPFGRVPKVLGRHRMVPPLGALPYTETVGQSQYLRMLFVWGYGPLEISDLKIGETPLSEFDEVEIETRRGEMTDAPISLYSNSVLQNDLQVNVLNSSGYITRTSETDADEISVDLTLPRGLFRFNNNVKASASVSIEIQYSPTGMNNWSAGASSYKSIAASVCTLTQKPAPFVIRGHSYRAIRLDRIALNAASGQLKCFTGNTAKEGDRVIAEPPTIPAGYHAIALVERRSDDPDIIPAGRITDERGADLFGKQFQDSSSFTPSGYAASNQISVSAGGLKFDGLYITAKQSAALRKCVTFKVPKGQYDVRVRRITADNTSDDIFDDVMWTALRTVRYTTPVTMTGLAVTALRIKATDQLNGIVDRFNGVVSSIIPDWTGTAWTEQPTSNPASIYRHVLQGAGNAKPLQDSRIDILRLQDWHERCTDAGYDFNAVIDYDVSVMETLQNVAACGRASPALIDGKWSVVEDFGAQSPVQHFSPRNTFSFQGHKSFDALPHALRVRFVNAEKGWQQDERLVYDDGYTAQNASEYESLELHGVTSSDQAWKAGRYHIATARLRPETYSFCADLEHIVCTRGDLVRFTHDVPLFGISSARVAVISDTGVTLDTQISMSTGKSYAIRFRASDGSSVVKQIVTAAGKTTSLVFVLSGANGVQAGDLALFGESGTESVALIVKSIEPRGDLTARLTCVDASPAIYQADTGEIPAFNSYVTLPDELVRPPAPVLLTAQSGEEALIRASDGSLTTRILITLEQPATHQPLETDVKIRACDETYFRKADYISSSPTQISIIDVSEGETYDIDIRYISKAGVSSPPLLISSHRVAGSSGNPSDISGFSLRVLGDTAHLMWEPCNDLDLHHYALRFTPSISGSSWPAAVDIISQIPPDATSISLPATIGSYLIKAVDIGGRMSENAAVCSTTASLLAGYNAVLTVDEAPAFSGTKYQTGLCGTTLQLAGADSIDAWPNIDSCANIDIGNNGLFPSGTYSFSSTCDLGAIYTSRLTPELLISAANLGTSVDTWGVTDTNENWDESVDPSTWKVKLEISITSDNPSGSPVWSAWSPLIVGDYTARAFRFRLQLESNEPYITPVISGLSIHIDMPDRHVSANGLVSLAAGSSIVFASPFRATPSLAISAQNMGSGDYYTLTGIDQTGFNIRFFNASGTGVSRTFDYFAKGYGEAT